MNKQKLLIHVYTKHNSTTEYRTSRNSKFTLTIHVSTNKFNILGTPFRDIYVESKHFSSHTLETKHNYDI